MDGESKDDQETTSCRLDALLHWNCNVVTVSVRIRITRNMTRPEKTFVGAVLSPDQSPMAELFHDVDENESGENKYFCHWQLGVSEDTWRESYPLLHSKSTCRLRQPSSQTGYR